MRLREIWTQLQCVLCKLPRAFDTVVVNLSGRGDKDLDTIVRAMGAQKS